MSNNCNDAWTGYRIGAFVPILNTKYPATDYYIVSCTCALCIEPIWIICSIELALKRQIRSKNREDQVSKNAYNCKTSGISIHVNNKHSILICVPSNRKNKWELKITRTCLFFMHLKIIQMKALICSWYEYSKTQHFKINLYLFSFLLLLLLLLPPSIKFHFTSAAKPNLQRLPYKLSAHE